MDINKISKKYNLDFYLKILFFKNNTNFGVYHGIQHYIDTIKCVQHYCEIENIPENETRVILLATIFHDFNYIPNRTDDENTKNAIEGFVRHSIEDKTTNFHVTSLLINVKQHNDIFGITNKLYVKGIKIIKLCNDYGYYLSSDTDDYIPYVMKRAYEDSTELNIWLNNEIINIKNFTCDIKSIKSDMKDKKDKIIEKLEWLWNFHVQTEISTQPLIGDKTNE